MINTDLLTSYAVQSSVEAISFKLAERYNRLINFPVMFYDWESGYTEQFKQLFAKVPYELRQKPWFTTIYTYGSTKPNAIQPRPLLENYITLYNSNGIKVCINAITRLVTVDILCSVLTNDGNYANSIALNRILAQSYWKNISYPNVFYPQWKPLTYYPENFTVIPQVPNGLVYTAKNSGKSGKLVVNWPQTTGEIIRDGDVYWTCYKAPEAKLEMHNFTKSEIKSPNVYTDDIRYIVEFSYSISFVGLEDANYQLNTIKGFDNHLYSIITKALQ